jgi:CSLREA domain-containing protein
MGLRIGTIVAAAALLVPGAAHAADVTVNTAADAVDAAVGDGACASATGACTLRAAVQEADAAGGKSTITVPAGRYRLTIAAAPQAGSIADSDAGNGDLDLNADISIRGAGVGETVIDGGGVDRVFEADSGTTTALTDLTVTGGDSTAGGSQEIDLGGGVLNKGAITLTRVELVGNKADGGGGMFSIPRTMPVIRDSLIANNQAFEGGGLRIDSGATIINTTIVGNSLRTQRPEEIQDKPVGVVIPAVDEISGYGGGIDHRGGADLTIVNSTITGNRAVKGGGGIGAGQAYSPVSEDLPLGRLRLTNTIIAGNSSAAGGQNCRTNEVKFESQGHNIDTDGSCFLTAKTDRPKTDPRLGRLADNGGPTRTLALLPGSPAIDGATSCPAHDQRGVARPRGTRCDIGAYERR